MNGLAEMKIGAIAPYFGGKRTLAPKIVAELGEHRAYWEPFCGSMAVLMVKERARAETVNDLHGDLINLARVIQDGKLGPIFYRRARRILFHEDLFRRARQAIRDVPEWNGELSVARALDFLVFSWMGRNGSAGLSTGERSSNICVRWSNNGGEPGRRWAGVIESIPAWRWRLRGVTILRRDGLAIVEAIQDAPDVAIYVDPPYLVKADRYLHDFADADHSRLAKLLGRFRHARLVVSYYEHPRLADLYPGWTKMDVPVNKGTANTSGHGNGGTRAPEVLLINGPSYTAGRTLFDDPVAPGEERTDQ